MTKAELLSKLDEESLRKIAKNEEFSIPKNYGKRDLVKYLEGTLTLEKIKEYTAEIYEKETKRTIIHETVKENGIRIKAKETTKITFDKSKVIIELTQKEKVDFTVLEDIAKRLEVPPPSGKGLSLYGKMNDKMLDFLNRIFVEKESDGYGLFLEYRTANFIKKQFGSKVKRIEVRCRKFFSEIGEIDVVGFDSENKPIVMAECKDRKAKKEDLDKWITNTRKLYQSHDCSLEESYFSTSKRLTNENFERIENSNEVDAERGQLKATKGIGQQLRQFANTNKGFKESGSVNLSMYEVRQNQFVKIFPRK